MKILYTTDLSRPVNGSNIYNSVSIIEDFEMFAVIVMRKITGYVKDKYAHVSTFDTFGEALTAYKEYGGILED